MISATSWLWLAAAAAICWIIYNRQEANQRAEYIRWLEKQIKYLRAQIERNNTP